MDLSTSPKLLLAVASIGGGVLLVAAEKEHICSSIMSGNFDQMEILSITWDTYPNEDAKSVLIFQSNDRTIDVPLENIGANYMNLTNVPVGSYSVDPHFHRAIDSLMSDKLAALYHFRTQYSFRLTNGYVMFTEGNRLLIYREFERANGGSIQFNGRSDTYPKPLAIVHNNKEITAHMYAINRDVFDGNGRYIIYRVWMYDPYFLPQHFQDLRPPKAAQIANETSRFYYLELTEDSSLAKLVHRRNQFNPNPSAQMFTSLPYGFIHRTSDELYLFDMDLGCVYHFIDWNEAKLDELFEDGKDLIYKRSNYPFEEYFLCDPVQFPKSTSFPHKRERCNTTVSNHGIVTSHTSSTTIKMHVKSSAKGLNLVAIGIGALVVFILIGLFFVLKNKRKCRSSKKSKKSKSKMSAEMSSKKSKLPLTLSFSSKSITSKRGKGSSKSKTLTTAADTKTTVTKQSSSARVTKRGKLTIKQAATKSSH